MALFVLAIFTVLSPYLTASLDCYGSGSDMTVTYPGATLTPGNAGWQLTTEQLRYTLNDIIIFTNIRDINA